MLALSALSVTTASGSAPVDHPESERLGVHLRALGTGVGKSTYGSTDVTGSGDVALREGETGHVYVAVGRFDRAGRADPSSLCMNATGTPRTDESPVERKRELSLRAPHVWWAEVKALPREIDRVELEITWEHLQSERPGEAVVVGGDTRRISVREGERHVLDFVEVDAGIEAGCYRNVTVDVTADVVEGASLAGGLLRYDLWLRHVVEQGRTALQRQQMVGQHGRTMEFRFAPLRFPVPGARLEDGSEVESIIEVLGEVRGRIRADATIDVSLDAERWVDAEKAGAPRRGGMGGGGTKRFNVVSGETVTMKLPPPSGRSGVGPGLRGSTTGQVEGDSTVWVDNAEFYAGARDEIILTVTREQ
jgi:hypothetical protein